MKYLNFKKKPLILFSIIFVFVIIFSVLIYTLFYNNENEVLKIENIIPKSALCVVTINNPTDFIKQSNNNTLARNVFAKDFFAAYFQIIKNTDSLMNKEKTKESIIKNQRFFISFHSTEKSIQSIFYISLNENVNSKEVIEAISSLYPSLIFEKVKYLKHAVFNSKNLCFSLIGNTLVVAKEKNSIIEVIKSFTENQVISSDKSFSEVYRTANEKADANIFINFNLLLNNKIQNIFSFDLSKTVNWGAFDFNLKDNSFVFNGLIQPLNDRNSILNLLKEQESAEIDFSSVLPKSTQYLLGFSFSNVDKLLKNTRLLTLKKADSTQAINSSFLNNEFALASIALSDSVSSKIVIMAIDNEDECSNELKKFSKNTDNEIVELSKSPSIFNELNVLSSDSIKFFTIKNGFLLLSSNAKVLKYIINNTDNKNTLQENQNFKNISKYFTAKSGMLAYFNLQLCKNSISELFVKDNIDFISSLISSIGILSFQVNTQDNLYLANIYVSKADSSDALLLADSIEEVEPKNNSDFTANDDIKVFELICNSQTNAKNLFIVDKSNELYFTELNGKVLWKYKLDSPIISDIQELDCFKNGKMQLIFNTKKSIYVIDKLGNNVKGFPFTPKNEITNGISVFDFDKKKDYRIIFCTKANLVENIGADGKEVVGWTKYKANENINKAIKYARIAGTDLLVIYPNNKSITLLNRRGGKIATTTNTFKLSTNNNFMLANYKGTACFAHTTNSGEVLFIFNNGKTELQNFGKFSDKHFMTISDINNDKRLEYIFADNKTVFIYSSDKKLILKKEFENQINQPLKLISLQEKYIEICTLDNIFLVNNKGVTKTGFPIKGTTKFYITDANNDKKMELIVANKTKISIIPFE
ncbi:MAG: hypothetical protein WCK02_05320 [Bacteroidota bacterium]